MTTERETRGEGRGGVGEGKRERQRRTSLGSIVSSPPFNSDFVTNSYGESWDLSCEKS